MRAPHARCIIPWIGSSAAAQPFNEQALLSAFPGGSLLGIRGTARVFEIDPNTVLQWLVEAADSRRLSL
jgi:hypothetical protein